MAAMNETAVEYQIGDDEYGYVEVTVDDGEDIAEVLVQDATQSIELRLSADETRALIEQLQEALATMQANTDQ